MFAFCYFATIWHSNTLFSGKCIDICIFNTFCSVSHLQHHHAYKFTLLFIAVSRKFWDFSYFMWISLCGSIQIVLSVMSFKFWYRAWLLLLFATFISWHLCRRLTVPFTVTIAGSFWQSDLHWKPLVLTCHLSQETTFILSKDWRRIWWYCISIVVHNTDSWWSENCMYHATFDNTLISH